MTHAHTQESLYKRRHLTFFSSSNFTPMTLYSRKFGYKWWDEDKCPDEAARKEQTDLSCSTIQYTVVLGQIFTKCLMCCTQPWKILNIKAGRISVFEPMTPRPHGGQRTNRVHLFPLSHVLCLLTCDFLGFSSIKNTKRNDKVMTRMLEF